MLCGFQRQAERHVRHRPSCGPCSKQRSSRKEEGKSSYQSSRRVLAIPVSAAPLLAWRISRPATDRHGLRTTSSSSNLSITASHNQHPGQTYC